MHQLLRAIELQRAEDPSRAPLLNDIQKYLQTGDQAMLPALLKDCDEFLLSNFIPDVGPFNALDPYDRRMIQLAAACNPDMLNSWVALQIHRAPGTDETFEAIMKSLRDCGVAEEHVDRLALTAASASAVVPSLTVSGRYVLKFDDARLHRAALAGTFEVRLGLLRLLARQVPDRAVAFIPVARTCLPECSVGMELLDADFDRFEEPALALFRSSVADGPMINMAKCLIKRKPEKYGVEVIEAFKKWWRHGNWYTAQFVAEHLGPAGVDELMPFFMAEQKSEQDEQIRRDTIDALGKHIDPKVKAALLAVLTGPPNVQTRVVAIGHLLNSYRDDAPTMEIVADAIEAGLGSDARTAAKFAALAIKSGLPKLHEKLWSLVGGKSKLVRDAAAEAVAKADPQAMDRAGALLTEKSKDARWGGVLVLGHLASQSSIDMLIHRLPRESDADVRDAIARALRALGVSSESIARSFGPIDMDQLRSRVAAIKNAPAQWLAEDGLPALRFVDGGEVDRPIVRYLLHRQSKQREPIPDPEASQLYLIIDRKTSGDFAHKLLAMLLDAGPTKADAWALIVAGMLGDNRVIATLSAKIRTWADAYEQKLGTWAIEALAINGTDAALMGVHAVAEKYRNNTRKRYAVVAEAAQEAIELAAKRLGITMDELGDRVVPTLGFEPGRPRIVETPDRTIEATIGLDFKLAMKDAKTGKRTVSIPKSAPPDLQTEFKGLGKLLTEAAKSQTARLETLMVRQRRWLAKRFRELYLQHPLLFPFAVQLMWGGYDSSGQLASTFRALPDRTLTDAVDEPVELDESLCVGIVHPLDLSRQQIDAWRTHLGDYEITTPFPQMDRQVVEVKDDERDSTTCNRVRGASVNWYGFRAKAERSGWGQGAVVADVLHGSYRKRFDALGIDAFVTIGGLMAWGDPTATVTVDQVLFLPQGTQPEEFRQKLMRLGDVPKMAFSESVGDLMRICGKSEMETVSTSP